MIMCAFAFSVGKTVFTILRGWVAACITVASEIASALRVGEIGPFHVG
ncbi:uncharacterized protein LOC116263174 [Nymphaea colorata]|nr:uncharacterized protein LOC116263174 [Nymphaea colorata]XP_049935657.1 uncharacterized protein LOC116263174 [Nymphaea colorata]